MGWVADGLAVFVVLFALERLFRSKRRAVTPQPQTWTAEDDLWRERMRDQGR